MQLWGWFQGVPGLAALGSGVRQSCCVSSPRAPAPLGVGPARTNAAQSSAASCCGAGRGTRRGLTCLCRGPGDGGGTRRGAGSKRSSLPSRLTRLVQQHLLGTRAITWGEVASLGAAWPQSR